ncbi:hypothetical protein SOVF_112880 isoform A [Spinacia oleracea]|nr:hypothetical protein SOVF_112880 isoform A [Spinacia oleracea]
MEGFNNDDDHFMGGSLPNVDVYCQADNCTSDLTDAKRYHRRHKVCEFHAKAPVVIVNSKHQRFCQQCSKCVSTFFLKIIRSTQWFHDVSEFDDTKRSCRRRLAGHNERRRKNSYDVSAESSSAD